MGKASRDRTLVVDIPIRTISESNAREHHHAKAKRVKNQRRIVALMLASKCELPVGETYVVTLTRIAPRQLDDDNLARSFKAIRDEVAARLGHDDGPRGPISWHYKQRKGEAKQHSVEVRIEADPELCPTCGAIR